MDVAIPGDNIIDDILNGMCFLTPDSGTAPSSIDSHELRNLFKLLIQDVVQKEKRNHAELELLRWLKKLVYWFHRLNVMLEELSANALLQEQSKKRNITSYLFKFKPIRYRLKLKVIQEIMKVTEELDGLASMTKALPQSSEEGRKLADLDPEFEKKLEAVGREKRKKEIIDQLMLLRKKSGEVAVPAPVITIVGIAGIGKTKLAHLVCGDEEVKAQFGLPIWVDGSGIHETFDVESIAKSVIDESANRDSKCYLLVLDDLRVEIFEESLMTLQQKLTEAGLSIGAILITTRSNLVAKKMSTSVKPYALHGLSEEDSLSLFRKIQGRKGKESEERKIVRKCRGVPQAIISLARLLRDSKSKADDEAEAAELLKEEFLRELKSIYYDNLPTLQKCCFAYCSLFPQNYLIDAERLIQLWMGEGFLTPWNLSSSNQEEVGRECFNDFLGRSVFEDVKEDECGVVRSCRMNHLMHDLASLVAGDKNIIMNSNRKKVPDGLLRASFHFIFDVSCGIPPFLFKRAKNLRTILLLANTKWRLPHEVKMTTSVCDQIFRSFKRLRLLDLHDLGIKTVPRSIGELNNLRYLDLSQNNIERLPGSITKLYHLQTLKLSQCHLLKKLPKDLKNLSSLRHLDIEGCLDLTHMPPGIKNLTSLHTLSHFVVTSKNYQMGGLRELVGLNNLRGHLEIFHLERLNFPASPLNVKHAYLEKKQHLQGLTLSWEDDDDDDEDEEEEEDIDGGRHHHKIGDEYDKDKKLLDCLQPHSNLRVLLVGGYKGYTLSDWLASIQSLVKFTLYNCPKCQFLPPLDHLPSLKILELESLDSLKYIAEHCGNNTSGATHDTDNTTCFFPSLKELTISDCPKLRSWWRTEKTVQDRPFFTCISKLHVQYCPKLTCMPLYACLDKELVLVGSSIKPLKDTICYRTEKEGIFPFSRLKSMLIASVKLRSPPEEWLKNFISLEKLHIRDCPQFKFLPQGFKHLSSLQCLTVENCPKLDLDGSKTMTEWKSLKNLRSLTIREIPNLKSLPLGVEDVASLQDLKLHNCPELTSLPNNIGKLTSLSRLEISECNKLASLPKQMRKLKSLRTLIISDCTLLLPRCQQETGDDWRQIAHIKNIQTKKTSRDL